MKETPYDYLLDERVRLIQHLFAKYGKRVLLPGALAVIILLFFFTNKEEQASFELISEITPTETQAVVEQEEVQIPNEIPNEIQTIYVDVKGAVHYPGVYSFTTEDRITDAIQQAGGYTEQANSQLINHAQKLQDEMIIYIPRTGEEVPEMVAMPTSTSATDATSAAGKVNINQADVTQLTTLPGIGPAKATAIIAHREDKGAFTSIDSLKDVTGIGDKTFEQLQDLIDIK